MALEQLARLTSDNPLYELQRVNHMGERLFDFRLFPKRHKFPEIVDNSMIRGRISDFFDRVQQGLPLVTRRDDPNYDPGMHDGRFVEDSNVQNTETDAFLASLGLEVQEETLAVEVLDPNVLPSVKHTLVAIGSLNKMQAGELPYVNEFQYEARRFWGRELTVGTVREMVEDLSARAHASLYGGTSTNYRELPVAQLFVQGSKLSTEILKQSLGMVK